MKEKRHNLRVPFEQYFLWGYNNTVLVISKYPAEVQRMNRKQFKSLSVQLPLLLVVSVLIIMLVVVPLVYHRFHDRMIDQYARMGEGVTQLIVNAIDGDDVDEYIEKNFSLPEYVDTVDYLYTLRDNYPDILYLYIYRFEADGGHVVIDLDADWWEDGEGYEPGTLWGLDEMEEPFASQLEEVMAGKQISGYAEHTKADGYLYTYTRPIFRSDGSYSCTACVDFSMDYLYEMDKDFTVWLTLIMLGIGAAVVALDVFVIRKKVTRPINELSGCAGKFAYDTEEDRKNNIQMLEAVNINTEDEIEDVYSMLYSVAADSYKATESLTKAIKDIHDKDGMITAMSADYRSIYHVDLDRDECICVRSSSGSFRKTWDDVVLSFRDSFIDYANRYVKEADREGFLKFIDPDNIRAGLAKEAMLAHRYLTEKNGVEQYEMLRIAGVRTIDERSDNIVHAIGIGFSDVDRETRSSLEQRRALTEALAKAEEASAAKTSFLSSMSHEIRTPMNAIIGLDNIALRDPNISEATRDELEKIGSSARHLLSLINDILDMSRIESGRMVLKAEVFSFREMTDQINTIINGQCEDKRLTYESHIIGEVEEYFIGDALRLRQVIINILGNAVKFTDPPGTVTFTVEQTGMEADRRMLRFIMKDTGIGMDKDYIPKLFEPFSQEDATTTNRYGGSGLGMSITKNMVDLMGGSISVESEKGRGSTFTVDIPLQVAQIAADPGKTDQEEPDVLVTGKHVLIAEDMEMNAEILTDLLDVEGFTSEWAENGQKALEMFEQNEAGHFDAILMDMRMPVMDGLTATREIRKLSRPDAATIPIIALTANAFEEDVQQCLQAGMNAHLSKPVEIELLKKTLGKLLSGRA